MISASNKYEYFNQMKFVLESKGIIVSDSNEINYGLQFHISYGDKAGLIRIYESKKGIRHDFSQVKDRELLTLLEAAFSGNQGSKNSSKSVNREMTQKTEIEGVEELIGTDESGKGDYFGPLVIAGVYVNAETSSKLNSLGVMDSKKLNDEKIRELARQIKKICPHSVVVIGNAKYNELYKKMDNLNKLLGWGHARAIENVLEKVDCSFALSDQFGDESIIKKALLNKGKEINLFQRTKAESNVAVAAASILARDEFVDRLNRISDKYDIQLPKGASIQTVNSARKFVSKFNKQELSNVAKLHFKTTKQL